MTDRDAVRAALTELAGKVGVLRIYQTLGRERGDEVRRLAGLKGDGDA